MDKIISLCKRRGFIFPGSEIYGGLSGVYDYGPLGVELENNIAQSWWKNFVYHRDDIYGLNSGILMKSDIWAASGHLTGFADPMVECNDCKNQFKADDLENNKTCPNCGGGLAQSEKFNMMFKTNIGVSQDKNSQVYLRPENAQGMFINFKNVLDTMHPKLPFGIAQRGRVFRNEISPREFIFRCREFEIMEFEYFIQGDDWQNQFKYWLKESQNWLKNLGLDNDSLSDREVEKENRAHYSQRTVDIDFKFPQGNKEIAAVAYRGEYDLKNHAQASGQDLSYFDNLTNKRFIPHVIEPTFGLDRIVMAVLTSAYHEEIIEGKPRVVLKLKPSLSPYLAAVFPLLSNKSALVEKAREIYQNLKMEINNSRPIVWDDRGNIGKRYYAQDEIGTPYCLTIDFQTLTDDTITIRDRDTMRQERVAVKDLTEYLKS